MTTCYIWEFDKSEYILMISDEQLINRIQHKRDLKRTEAETAILNSYKIAQKFKNQKPGNHPIESNDHQPCNECGNVDFLRTGTCFVCITCGKSQGCS